MEKHQPGIPHPVRLFLSMNHWHAGRELMVVQSKVVYLASPYSHDNYTIRAKRYLANVRAAAFLMAQGEYVFSPIAHSHPITLELEAIGEKREEQKAFERWREFDLHQLMFSREVIVLMLRDWAKSAGVMEEIRSAQANSIPVSYVRPEDVGLGKESTLSEVMPTKEDLPSCSSDFPSFVFKRRL